MICSDESALGARSIARMNRRAIRGPQHGGLDMEWSGNTAATTPAAAIPAVANRPISFQLHVRRFRTAAHQPPDKDSYDDSRPHTAPDHRRTVWPRRRLRLAGSSTSITGAAVISAAARSRRLRRAAARSGYPNSTTNSL
jgi:hypothetical protein